jgi:hypothetical protein
MAGKGTLLGYLFAVITYKFEIAATILITKFFANMKGTIYGNRLPRGMQVKKRLGTTALGPTIPS